ncbi:MAG: hypothetical protein FJ267_15775, partial [Planctomycetes bacterium]|nr:hypothetical protein [Planctomycetota bacterium]
MAELRKERESMRKAKKSEARDKELAKTLDAITKEVSEVKLELLAVRKMLRFTRPKDFANPSPVESSDFLLPAWPKFEETYVKLVVKDAELQEKKGELENAFRLLEEIWTPIGTHEEVTLLMSRVADRMIDVHVQNKDFRQARHFLNRLASLVPENEIVTKWKDRLSELAISHAEEARTAKAQGDSSRAVELIEKAVRIWPEAAGVKDFHRELVENFQRIRIGLFENPSSDTVYPYPSEETVWKDRLTSAHPFFEPKRFSSQEARYQSPYLDSWEPTDLGRKVRFTLKGRRATWESREVVSSTDFYEELTARLDPLHAKFDERMAGYVDGISVQSPSQFTIMFHRVPLRLESLLRFSFDSVTGSDSDFKSSSEADSTDGPDAKQISSESPSHMVPGALFREVRDSNG